MFIEKLTKEDVKEYLLSEYPKEKYHITGIAMPLEIDGYIRANIKNTRSIFDQTFHIVLEDFESSDNSRTWVNYLHEKFGDEYKKAYLDNAAKIFYE